jgi:hypothetical protein
LCQLSNGSPDLVKVDPPHQEICGKIALFIPLLHKLRLERALQEELIRCRMIVGVVIYLAHALEDQDMSTQQ